MKVIFLDYDGVLNRLSDTYSTPVRTINGVMTMAEPELVYRLNLIVDRTDAELVLSSSWRHMREWRAVMRLSGIMKAFHGKTGNTGGIRGEGIQEWIDEHSGIERYAILDDYEDMLPSQLPNFFKTDPKEGLSQKIADDIERHLS